MTQPVRTTSLRFRLGIFFLAALFVLVILLAFLPPDGVERGDWMQFIGRFHLLIIHFPIALFLLVPVLELAKRRMNPVELNFAGDLVLALAAIGAIVAASLGWSLARSGGYSGSLIDQHMWAGIGFAAVCCAAWVLRAQKSEPAKRIYVVTLVAAVGLVGWTGYRGGQLSQGENHFTDHMPESLRGLLGMSPDASAATVADPHTFYGARIQPLFSGHCVSCHGASRHKGNLRLDSYAALMRGGKDGVVVKAGDLSGSELFHRITLPASDEKFMPAENKRPLSSAEVQIIGGWISAGASPTLAMDAMKGLPADAGSAEPPKEVTFPEVDLAQVAKERASDSSNVAQLQQLFPDSLDYESRNSADLTVDVSLLGSRFSDADLVKFKPVANHLVEADFSNTAITDRSAPVLAVMQHLRVLRLMHTKITDVTLQALGSLTELESLSLFDTPITASGVKGLANLPKLKHVYAGETKITAGAPLPEDIKGKVSF
jgi:cytochrome c/predicted membrane protein DUF2231